MNRMNRIVVAALAVLALADVASGQSLGDLARRERERKSGGPEPAVITTEMVAGRSGETSPSAPKPNPTAAGAPTDSKPAAAGAGATEKKEEKKGSEAWWRQTFKEARENSSRADAQVRALEIQLAEANKALLIRDDVFNKEGQLIPIINGLTADLDTARRRADEARQKIVDLEEELRRSGGLPGWAR
jgi:hypothetical protein